MDTYTDGQNIRERTFQLAVRVVNLCRHLDRQPGPGSIIARQLIRSGTSIGANVYESTQAESGADFIHKLGIARKDAVENEFWLHLFRDGSVLSNREAESLLHDCDELERMPTASLKTAKSRTKNKNEE